MDLRKLWIDAELNCNIYRPTTSSTWKHEFPHKEIIIILKISQASMPHNSAALENLTFEWK